MDCESRKFGRGPRELTGAVDLINHYRLLPHHDFFCKKTLPLYIAETKYLRNVAGDTIIRKGDGMQLDQLLEKAYSKDSTVNIQPFQPEILIDAFPLVESTPVILPPEEKGIPTFLGKAKEKKHKKHKNKDKGKEKEHKKSKHSNKDRSKDKDKKKERSGHHDSATDHSRKHHDKKRKHGDEDGTDSPKHKKSKGGSKDEVLMT